MIRLEIESVQICEDCLLDLEQDSVRTTLDERGETYGSFADVANVSQTLQDVLIKACHDNDNTISFVQAEALQMIAAKLARIVVGDANHADSWHDIAGYATLARDDIEDDINKQ